MRNKTAISNRMRLFVKEQGLFLKKDTLRSYHTALFHFHAYLKEKFKAEMIRREHIAKLTREDMQKYLFLLNKKELAPITMLHRAMAIKRYLEWEAERQDLPENILEAIDPKHLSKVPEYLPRPLSSETDIWLQDILRHSNNPYANIFLLLRQTGLRIGELIQLPKDCVVSLANDEKYLKVPLGKLNSERLVPLHPETVLLIKTIQANYPIQRWRRRGRKKRYSTDPVCDPDRLIGLKGDVRYVYPVLQRQFKEITGGKTDQGKPITFHRLRHTYATSLLSGGISIVAIMKLLGHRKIKMSLQYAKVTPSYLRQEYLKAVETMEKQWNLKQNATAHSCASEQNAADIICQMQAFVRKSADTSPKDRKNLLLRLSRLADDLNKTSFSEKFKLTGQTD